MFIWESELVSALWNLVKNFVLSTQVQDVWRWTKTSEQTYASKVGYDQMVFMAAEERAQRPIWPKAIWNNLALLKINAFIWKLLHNRFPSLVNLKRRNLILNGEHT